jgi:hypothetical protein
MSEVKLNVLDACREVCGTMHCGEADAVVAALSAEPETIAELEDAVARFSKPAGKFGPFAAFHAGTDQEPWDAGIIFIDLAARIVAVESTYSIPSAEGQICYHNGKHLTDVLLSYRNPDDWLFLDSVEEYLGARDERRAQRAAVLPLDSRPILYGTVMEFIVNECLAVRSPADAPVAQIHAKWLMTPRADLRGQSPREVLLIKREFLDADLWSREAQWSRLGKPAPGLKRNSTAYRFAGFGTHEVVLYYELVRLLISECWKRVSEEHNVSITDEVARLEQIKEDWLQCPQPDLENKNPAFVLECERRRLPLLASPESLFDEDCYLCQSMAEGSAPTFWHLDGCNMDDDFPFSFCATRDEWEQEQRNQEQFMEEFNRRHPSPTTPK